MKGAGDRSTRRQSREWCVQILFQVDMNPDELDRVLSVFWSGNAADAKARAFTERLVRGVRTNIERVDGIIVKYTEHWDIGRMGIVERNAIRMAVYEMTFCPDIPPVVSINEAVDIAKYFSVDDSGRFVNGILDRIRIDGGRPARTRGPVGGSEGLAPEGGSGANQKPGT